MHNKKLMDVGLITGKEDIDFIIHKIVNYQYFIFCHYLYIYSLYVLEIISFPKFYLFQKYMFSLDYTRLLYINIQGIY